MSWLGILTVDELSHLPDISPLASQPMVLFVRPTAEVKSVQSLLHQPGPSPDSSSSALPASASTAHLAAEKFKSSGDRATIVLGTLAIFWTKEKGRVDSRPFLGTRNGYLILSSGLP
ncbi:MAG: hypothetical protein FIA94_14605 [Nitrospirae bacterium]|nr:hypothetical protein [Nitrospirota bacterium]